ncbi:MAG: flagellin [Proteobacteria bacterium]|nr:flagellin [Pseudomonadota bacterium]
MAAAYNLSSTNVSLQRSLNRLSSGSRINSSFDDAGGLAVSMKLSASIRRTEATQANVSNALSLLQTQDGVLKTAEKVLNRLAELTQLSADVTKTTADIDLYQTEFDSLVSAISSMADEKFNDISLFSSAGSSLDVVTSQDGSQSVTITIAASGDLITNLSGVDLTDTTAVTSNIAAVTAEIQSLATARAQNGADQQRLTFASDMLAVNKTNLEAANGRIVDVDIASESANLARLSILQQAGTAMLAQANQANQSLLRLLV